MKSVPTNFRVKRWLFYLIILFDYFEDLEDDAGESIELDVIAISCDYAEDTFETIAEQYPDFRKVFNQKIDQIERGKIAFYDYEKIGDFVKIAKILGVKPSARSVFVSQNGLNAGRVTIDSRPDFLGLILPFRHSPNNVNPKLHANLFNDWFLTKFLRWGAYTPHFLTIKNGGD